MLKANDTLDDHTKREVLVAVMAMQQAFEEAASQIDRLFPYAAADERKEMIGLVGRDLISATAIALEYDHTGDVSEGLVSDMLKAGCKMN